jgi:hypothetical protein
MIRIGNGQGFWGDLPDGPVRLAEEGPLDYLTMDYLAEVTMSIMQKQRARNPELGYARDFIPVMERVLPLCRDRGLRVVTNAGGIHPRGCAQALAAAARRLGIKGLRIGVVCGDDILARLTDLAAAGETFASMDTGEPLSSVHGRVTSANVYFGAAPIVEALAAGCQVVLTGRVTDTALVLGPMIHEFGWSMADYDRLAAGIIAGHIVECGTQCTGGNFQAGWREVPDYAGIGFPVLEAWPDGTFVVTKHDGTGGRVDLRTVKEQLLYETGDPRRYITPEVTADFTSIRLIPDGADRVRVSGARGGPPTPFYKVSISYADGYKCIGQLTYGWPEALDKARLADRILRERLRRTGLAFEAIHTEFLGYDACHGPLAHPIEDPNEVALRIGVRTSGKAAGERFGREFIALLLTGPPTVTGFGDGRPQPSEVIAYWPALLPKERVSPVVEILEV